MVERLAYGVLIVVYGGLSMFSLVWLVASQHLTFIKPPAWVDIALNLHGSFTLIALLIGQVAVLYLILGSLALWPLGVR